MATVMSDSSELKPDVAHKERTASTTSDQVHRISISGKDGEKTVEVNLLDPVLDKRVVRKFDLHVIPWLFGIWLFAFIDRANIGNAKIDGLTQDLGMDGNKFNIALAIFYVPYIVVDVPSNWLVKRVGSGLYLPALITAWGLTSTFMGFTKSYEGLLAARFFLGMFEGGLLGGIVVYLAMFYRRHEMLWRLGMFYTAAPLSGAFGGLLATGLAQIQYNGYNRWPWIFFIEGILTVLFGLTAMVFLPNNPGHAKFLSPEEKAFAMARLRADAQGSTNQDDIEQEKFDWHWVKMALKAPQLWFCSLVWFAILVPLYSFSLFVPTIIRDLGYQAVTAQLLTVPPYVLATIVVLVSALYSDKIKMRGYFIIAGAVVSAVGFIMLLASEKSSVKYGGIFLAAIGCFPCSPMVMGWMSNNTAPHYVRATAVGLQIAIANCSAFIATFTYLEKDSPRYILGHSINIGACILCIVIAALGVFYCKWENHQRDMGKRDYRLQDQDESRLGHNHPKFRLTI